MPPNIKSSLKGLPLYLSIITALTLLVYSNVLHGEPQFDDEHYIFSEPLLQSPYSFINLDMFQSFASGMRPVTAFTFSLNHYFGGADTFSYHLTNLIIHTLNGIMVYVLIYMTLQSSTLTNRYSHNNSKIALLTSLLFLIHPIQTESVSYIYQRAESLSSLCYLASLLSFILAVRSESPKRAAAFLALFSGGFIIALGSKEIAVTLPLVAFLYGMFFLKREGVWKKVALPGFLIVAGIVIAAHRILILGKNTSAGFHLQFTMQEYLLTQLRVIVTYLRLLMFPVQQNIDYDHPIYRSLLNGEVIMSLIFLLAVLSASIIIYKKQRAASFFILWFFIILFPSSSILPLKDVIVEHRLYLPSVGLFFILSSSLVILSDNLNKRFDKRVFFRLTVFSIFLMIFTLSASTYHRNNIWKSRIAMWQDVVKKSPRKSRPHNNLGNCYLLAGNYKNAIREFITSIDINPGIMETYYNIGLSFENLGMSGLAKEFYTVYAKYGTANDGIARKLSVRYNIDSNTPVPDIDLVKEKARETVRLLYGAK